MNRHTLLDVYLGLRADALRAVTGALMLSSAGGAADAAIHHPNNEKPTVKIEAVAKKTQPNP